MDKKIYERNMELLKNLDPAVAKKIEEAPDFSSGELIESKIGLPTLRVSQNGRSALLHSSYDPRQEAQRIISKYQIEENDYIIALGFGLGYYIKEILQKPYEIRVWVIEPEVSLFKKALCLVDVTSILPRIKLILEKDPIKIERKLRLYGQMMLTGRVILLPHSPSLGLFPEYGQIRKAVLDTIHWARVNFSTNINRGTLFQRNILTNIPEIIKNPGIEPLFGQFKNKPAICVAAGPSLDKNIQLLSRIKSRALIICADGALKVLLRHGIKPDIVTSIHPEQLTTKLFEGSWNQTKDISLASDPEVYPEVLANFQGRKFIISINKPAMIWLLPFLRNRTFLRKGLTVAHTSFFIAQAFGCDPIILVGQDLSYPTRMSHAQGMSTKTEIGIATDSKTQQKYLVKVDRSKKNWKAEPLKMVKDMYGKEIPTSADLYSYLIYFEDIIARARCTCINATEGGAKIRGTKIMTLAEVIDKYCQKPIAVREILEKAHRQDEVINIELLKKHTEKTIIILNGIHFWAKEGQAVLKKLSREIKRKNPPQQEKERLMRESNRIRDRLMSVPAFLREMIEENMYANVCLILKKSNLEPHLASERKRVINQMEKAELYYGGVEKVCRKLCRTLEETLDKI